MYFQKEIELIIQEENSSYDSLLEDFNTADEFKSEVVTYLNECENTWSSNFSDYKPFISYDNYSTTNKGLDEFNGLNVQDDRKIEDQYPFTLH